MSRRRNLPYRRPLTRLVAGLALVVVLATCTPGRAATIRVRRDARVERGTVYRIVGGHRLRLDAYLPAAARSRAIGVLVIHGGAWVAGTRSLLEWEGTELARAGFTAFALDYRLAPEVPFPAALDDVHAALAWVRARAGDYGVDPDRIGAVGLSAGANLVALLATRADRAGLAAGVSWSGPMDLTAAGAGREPGLRTYIDDFLGCEPAACTERARAASPAFDVTGTPPPMLLINSTDELVSVADFTEMTAALRAAHGTVDTILLPGQLHAEQYRSQIWERTLSFLADHLRREG